MQFLKRCIKVKKSFGLGQKVRKLKGPEVEKIWRLMANSLVIHHVLILDTKYLILIKTKSVFLRLKI